MCQTMSNTVGGTLMELDKVMPPGNQIQDFDWLKGAQKLFMIKAVCRCVTDKLIKCL